MKHIKTAFIAEIMKLRRARIFWITVFIFMFMPVMMGLLMYISQHPELAEKLGLLGDKAKLFTSNDWPSFFDMMLRAVGAMSLLGFGFIATWTFGREYTERTLKDILAIPVPRSAIVFAKFLLISIWSLFLVLLLFIMCLAEGNILSLPHWETGAFTLFAWHYFGVAILSLLLTSPVAFLAGYSKGIIAPLGFLVFAMILSQIVGVIGLGPYFPWTIPSLFAVPDGMPGMNLVPVSYIILVITGLSCYWATDRWWRKGDHV